MNQSMNPSRLEPDVVRPGASHGEGAVGHDPAHRPAASLPLLDLLLRPRGRQRRRDVISRLLHPISKLHVRQEHLPAGLQAVSE